MRDKKQGVVRLEGVVLPDGTVGDVCVRHSLDPDLDIEAVAAAKGFEFLPGTRDGQPVAVLVSFEIEFTLTQ
jgi:TonB family protein